MRDQTLAITVAVLIVFLHVIREKWLRGVATASYTSMRFVNGSVVLVNGMSSWHEVVTQEATGSPVTHVGVVAHDASGVPFLFHTTRATGATLTPLIPWLQRTIGPDRVFVRHPSHHVDNQAMEAAVRPLLGTPYTYRLWKAVFRRWGGPELPFGGETHGLFCSELVCKVFESLGVMNFTASGLVPSLVLPCHFVDGGALPRQLRLGRMVELVAFDFVDN